MSLDRIEIRLALLRHGLSFMKYRIEVVLKPKIQDEEIRIRTINTRKAAARIAASALKAIPGVALLGAGSKLLDAVSDVVGVVGSVNDMLEFMGNITDVHAENSVGSLSTLQGRLGPQRFDAVGECLEKLDSTRSTSDQQKQFEESLEKALRPRLSIPRRRLDPPTLQHPLCFPDGSNGAGLSLHMVNVVREVVTEELFEPEPMCPLLLTEVKTTRSICMQLVARVSELEWLLHGGGFHSRL